MSEMVTMNVSPEIVKPIVEQKIKEAILEGLGGKDKVIDKVIMEIMNKKVDSSGTISRYDSDNRFTWLDIVLTKQIKDIVEAELKVQIANSSGEIKSALIKQIKSKAGSDLVASALLAGLSGSFENSWRSQINIGFTPFSKH